MTNLSGEIERTVGNAFGLSPWIEQGFKHAENRLGWMNDRLMEATSIAGMGTAHVSVFARRPQFPRCATALSRSLRSPRQHRVRKHQPAST
jgi:hypothetical protein